MTPSPNRGEILRQMRAAARDTRCFVAVGPQTAIADAAVVVSLDQTGDVDAALEVVRKARAWLSDGAAVFGLDEALG